jgi:Zn-dependent protease
LAILALFLLKFDAVSSHPVYSAVLPVVARINIILGAFNLIPIPPLDGSKIVMSLLSERARESFARLEPYGLLLLVVLLFTGMLNPVITFMQEIIYSLISMVLGLTIH